jgi:hypothetical protein
LKKLFWSVAQYWQVEMTTRLKWKIQYFEAGAARQNTKICINIIHVNGSVEDHTSQKASKHQKKRLARS